MGQFRHCSATTTHAARAAIQRPQASFAQLSRELGAIPTPFRRGASTRRLRICRPGSEPWVIRPVLTGCRSRLQAAIFSFWAGAQAKGPAKGYRDASPDPGGGATQCALVSGFRFADLRFVHDQFAKRQRFRVLNVVDDVTRKCLAAIPFAMGLGPVAASWLTLDIGAPSGALTDGPNRAPRQTRNDCKR